MNWNEGSLSRHARGKGWKEDDARQKEHFAKAHARAREAPSASTAGEPSFVPDYIPHAAAGNEGGPEAETAPGDSQPGIVTAAAAAVADSGQDVPGPDALGQDSSGDDHQFALALAMPDAGLQHRNHLDDDDDDIEVPSNDVSQQRKQQLLEKKDWAGLGASSLGPKFHKISFKVAGDAAKPDDSRSSLPGATPSLRPMLRLTNRLTGDGSFWPQTNPRDVNILAPREEPEAALRRD